MTTFRRLIPIECTDEIVTPKNIGKMPDLRWIPVAQLVVDDRYQRGIGKAGRPNIQRILASFDWRKFTPVIVTPVGDEAYAIIDGQHRATAALMHPAITYVPCMVIDVTPGEAAACFAAINGCVTGITKGQIWRARILSGDNDAVELQRVLDAADVKILTSKLPQYTFKAGETPAIVTLERCMKKFGADVLRTALQAITQTSNGNPGGLTSSAIHALCEIIKRHTIFQVEPSKLFAMMDEIDVLSLYEEAHGIAKHQKRSTTNVVRDLLSEKLLGSIVDFGRIPRKRRTKAEIEYARSAAR